MKYIVAGIVAFFSGFMIWMIFAMAFLGDNTNSAVVVTIVGLGWFGTTWVLLRGQPRLSKVFSRSFLVGAALWLAMLPVGLIIGGRGMSETVAQESVEGAELAGATVAAGIVSVVGGGLSLVMIFVCLLGYLISHLLGREMKAE